MERLSLVRMAEILGMVDRVMHDFRPLQCVMYCDEKANANRIRPETVRSSHPQFGSPAFSYSLAG